VLSTKIRWNAVPILFLLASSALVPMASGTNVWTNALPTTNLNSAAGSNRSNVAPLYGSMCDANISTCPGGTNAPYILGDQFNLTGPTNISQVTVFEVGNVATDGASGVSPDTPADEFSAITLYLGADGSSLANISSSYSAFQVQYNFSTNYESIGSPGTFYPIFAITFSGLNVNLLGGLNDFAIGATPIGGNVFALHASDPLLSGAEEDSSTVTPNGFLYYFYDGSGGAPIATYQYTPGSINGYNNNADANVLIVGTAITPEPSTFGLFGMGLAAVCLGLRRRAHRV
jgi:hypothetical protein